MTPEHTVEYDMLLKETNRLKAENKRLDGVNIVLEDHITGLQSCLDRIERIVGEDNS